MTSNSADIQEIRENLKWIAFKEEKSLSFLEKAKEKTGGNPLVPLGCLVTVGILCYGLKYYREGNSVMQQKMMRWRIVAQGATIAITTASLYFAGKWKP